MDAELLKVCQTESLIDDFANGLTAALLPDEHPAIRAVARKVIRTEVWLAVQDIEQMCELSTWPKEAV